MSEVPAEPACFSAGHRRSPPAPRAGSLRQAFPHGGAATQGVSGTQRNVILATPRLLGRKQQSKVLFFLLQWSLL